MNPCSLCGKHFSRGRDVKRHQKVCPKVDGELSSAILNCSPYFQDQNINLHQHPHSGKDFYPHLVAPFTMCISGMTQSGKSTLVKEMLIRRNEIIKTSNDTSIDRITYCYTEFQPSLFGVLKSRIPQIQFHLGLPETWHDGSDMPSLLILDDLMHEAGKKGDVGAAFTRTSHHRNVSLIILVQNFFHKNLREITSNCHYIVLMKNPRDSQFVACLGRQMNGGKKNEAMDEAYKECMSKPYGYLFIDLTQSQDDLFRIRNNVFPEGASVFVNDTATSTVAKFNILRDDEYNKLLKTTQDVSANRLAVKPYENLKIHDYFQKMIQAPNPTVLSTLDKLQNEKDEILQSTNHYPEVKNMLIQDVLRRIQSYNMQVKEEPVRVKVIDNGSDSANVEIKAKEAENFDFSKFAKPAQRILQFFVDNDASLENGEVLFNNRKMPIAQFEEGIRKISDGRHKLTTVSFPRIFEFLKLKKFPIDMIPEPHQVLFQDDETADWNTPGKRRPLSTPANARKKSRKNTEDVTWEDYHLQE